MYFKYNLGKEVGVFGKFFVIVLKLEPTVIACPCNCNCKQEQLQLQLQARTIAIAIANFFGDI